MTLALLLIILLATLLLSLATFAQLLYTENLRLRTRDLPAIRYFRENLEARIGMSIEQGASSFSLIKHTSLLFLAILYCGIFADGGAWHWPSMFQALGAAWATMLAAAYAAPQVLYRRTEGRWLAPLAPLLRLMGLAACPLTGALAFFKSLIDLADEKNGNEEPPTQAENIEALISAGEEEGLIEEDDRRLIQSVMEFGDKTVREVMTPRPNIVAIEANASLEQLRELVIHEQYSRIPVYGESIDDVLGFIHVRDMFEVDEEERRHRTVRELMRPIRMAPETKPVNDLMREMQQESTHMVMVVDEYGNTAGLATMEDLVEVILGEIRDEHEPASDVIEDGQGGYIVSGNFDVARIGELVEFHGNGGIESSSVGGLVTEWLGRVPRAGEVVERDGIRIEVLASDERRVEQVRISRSQAVAQ